MKEIELTPKVKFANILIDINFLSDTSAFYKNLWSEDYINMIDYFNEHKQRLIGLRVGSSFTLSINDEKEVFTYGMND